MVVEKSGVTQDSDGAGGYGLVIDNPTTRDALWVSLYIHLLDARSHVVATQTQNLILMPAHGNVVGGAAAGILGQAVPGTNQRTFRVPIRPSPRVRSVGVTLGELVAPDRREPTQPVSA